MFPAKKNILRKLSKCVRKRQICLMTRITVVRNDDSPKEIPAKVIITVRAKQNHLNCDISIIGLINEPRHEKNGFLPLRKQRSRSASQ